MVTSSFLSKKLILQQPVVVGRTVSCPTTLAFLSEPEAPPPTKPEYTRRCRSAIQLHSIQLDRYLLLVFLMRKCPLPVLWGY